MKVWLGTAIYGGANAEYVSSLLKLQMVLLAMGHELEADFSINASDLARVSNGMMRRFNESGYDKLLFIDQDMAFNPFDIIKLLESDHGICGLDYRKKCDEVIFNAQLTGEKEGEWLQATMAGMGILCMSKDAIATMINENRDLTYTDDTGDTCALCESKVQDGRLYSGDYSFCRLWSKNDRFIYILADAEVTHVGQKRYTGNIKRLNAAN